MREVTKEVIWIIKVWWLLQLNMLQVDALKNEVKHLEAKLVNNERHFRQKLTRHQSQMGRYRSIALSTGKSFCLCLSFCQFLCFCLCHLFLFLLCIANFAESMSFDYSNNNIIVQLRTRDRCFWKRNFVDWRRKYRTTKDRLRPRKTSVESQGNSHSVSHVTSDNTWLVYSSECPLQIIPYSV